MSIIFIILALALIVLGFFIFGSSSKKTTLEFPNHNLKIEVELAENIVQWTKGLMFRKSLAQDSGMLFVFPDEAIRTFWMKNTYIPLDLIFISASKKIAEIKANFDPCQKDQCSIYTSQIPAQYVLEVNAGFVQKNNLQIGEPVVF